MSGSPTRAVRDEKSGSSRAQASSLRAATGRSRAERLGGGPANTHTRITHGILLFMVTSVRRWDAERAHLFLQKSSDSAETQKGCCELFRVRSPGLQQGTRRASAVGGLPQP